MITRIRDKETGEETVFTGDYGVAVAYERRGVDSSPVLRVGRFTKDKKYAEPPKEYVATRFDVVVEDCAAAGESIVSPAKTNAELVADAAKRGFHHGNR